MSINREDFLIREKTLKDPNGRGAKALKKRFRQIFDEEGCRLEKEKIEKELEDTLAKMDLNQEEEKK